MPRAGHSVNARPTVPSRPRSLALPSRRRAWRIGSRSGSGLPRRDRRDLRRDRQHRDGRARRTVPAGCLRARLHSFWPPVGGCSTTPSHVGRQPPAARKPAGPRSSTATSSPTARCTRWRRPSTGCNRLGSRSGTWSRYGSATPTPCARGWPTSSRTGTRPSSSSAGRARVWRSTCPGRRSPSSPTASASTRCSPSSPDPVALAASPGPGHHCSPTHRCVDETVRAERPSASHEPLPEQTGCGPLLGRRLVTYGGG